jgi:hypothetical protein
LEFESRDKEVRGLCPLGTAILLEASCALDPGLATAGPSALLSLTVLRETRSFALRLFPENELPDKSDAAVARRLVVSSR